MAPQYKDYCELQTASPPIPISSGPGGNNNAHALYCPNPDCSCIVIKAGVAVKTPTDVSITLPPYITSPTSPSAAAAGSLHPPFYWKLTDMMQFENIGFTKPVEHSTPTTSISSSNLTLNNSDAPQQFQFRYLSCADCDVGPLGYHHGPPTGQNPAEQVGLGAFGAGVGGQMEKEFLIAADRVRYKCGA
ncbi:hypothetical protein HK097_005118 [Rhizophlyctis rosea]|uniref:Uncharacterized protein n=1 Tax=Rhizophlyctis rosea TaxID=64517 RepID=A0AAD5SEI6_9FUNG|nr:hypothetical protein HK097_005118 [Rhizophlyctis rosea]